MADATTTATEATVAAWTNEKVMAAVASGDIDSAKGLAIMAELQAAEIAAVKASRVAGPPLVRLDGEEHGARDERPYRLCRGRSIAMGGTVDKCDLIYFMVVRPEKGAGFAGGLNVAIPVLRELVRVHEVGGMFAQALADYEDKTICYSREKPAKAS